MLTLDPAVETWAVACDRQPSLAVFVHMALDLQTQRRCKAGDWQALLDLLVEAGVPVEVYDAAVDVLHRTALMPCECKTCRARVDAGEKELAARPTLRTLGSTARAGSNAIALIRSRYDQTGRFRIGGRRTG